MSKMDELRALREARYEQTLARAATHRAAAHRAAAPKATERQATRSAEVVPPDVEVPASDPAVKLCGHRSIGGRTCTRERGHAAKSHRYS